MFRLKLIKKPILFKLKTNFSFPPIVMANMQEKEVIPTKEKQEIVPDKNYDGLSKVTVDKIPDEYIIPTGNIEITKNGIYNVREKETANVNIPVLKLGTKNITSNGVYKASDDELDGYSEVNVETSGVDINDYFKPTIAGATNTQYTNGVNAIIKKIPDTITMSGDSCASMFQYCTAITTIPLLDTSGVADMSKMFANCNSLQAIPFIDTSNVTTMTSMFKGCTNLQTIPPLNTSKVTNMTSMFEDCRSLQNIPAIDTSKVKTFESTFFACSTLKSLPLLDMSSATSLYRTFVSVTNLMHSSGFPNLGKAYLTTSTANNYTYTLTLSSCSKLTVASIINILNSLYDIKTKGCQSQKVVLGSTNLAKLKSEEGQQALSSATEKGWTVS
jgi:surface protein